MTHTNTRENERGVSPEVTLRGILENHFGIVDEANPLAAAARVAGYRDEYDALSRIVMAVAVGEVRKPAAKAMAAPGTKGRETEEDAKIPDDELLLVLATGLEDQPGGVSGPDWFRELTKTFEELGGKMSMTKDGFYARLKKLVARGQVKTSTAQVQKKLYGKLVVANVTLYSLPEEEATPAKEGGAE